MTGRSSTWAVGAALAVVVTLSAGSARAGNEAAAEALFEAAKKLAAQKKYAEACPKFAESNKLDRGAGTLIHLGDCYEKNKQTASAWATYKEASSAAQALGRRDWEKLATQRAAALEPKLARLTIKVVDPAPKLEVLRDGAPVSQASWGVPIPVDVGTHAVEATATGFKAFKASSTVNKDGDSVEVTIPKLEPEAGTTPTPPPTAKVEPTPPPSKPPPPPPHQEEDGSGQRTIGFVVAGVGVAGLAVGTVTGLMAMGKSSDAKKACPDDGPCADKAAVDSADSAKSLGLVSTIAFVAGGALVAGGAVLIFTAPGGKKTGSSKNVQNASIKLAPSAGPNGGGVTLLGVF